MIAAFLGVQAFFWLLLFSHPVMSISFYGLQHARPACPSPSSGVCSSSCPLHRWHHPAISSSDTLFSFCPQSFPASRSFLMSPLFASSDQNIGASASASVLPMNIQDWFPLGWTGLISLLSKGLLSLLQHHSSKASVLWHSAFFTNQFSKLYVISGKTIALTVRTFVGRVMSLLLNTEVCHSFPSKKQAFYFHGCRHHSQWFWNQRK